MSPASRTEPHRRTVLRVAASRLTAGLFSDHARLVAHARAPLAAGRDGIALLGTTGERGRGRAGSDQGGS